MRIQFTVPRDAQHKKRDKEKKMAKMTQNPMGLMSLVMVLTPLLIIAKHNDRQLTSKGGLNVIAIVLHIHRNEVSLNIGRSLFLSLSVSTYFLLNACMSISPLESTSCFPVLISQSILPSHSKSMH